MCCCEGLGLVCVIDAVVPEVTLRASRTKVVPGEKARLTCTIGRVNPAIYTISWSQDGTRVASLSVEGVYSASITVSFSDMTDAGNYTCMVRNDGGVGADSIILECELCAYHARS